MTIKLKSLISQRFLYEDDSASTSKFPGKFHLGGGYYSSKEGGEAEFKSDGDRLKPLTPQEKAARSAQSPAKPSAPVAATPSNTTQQAASQRATAGQPQAAKAAASTDSIPKSDTPETGDRLDQMVQKYSITPEKQKEAARVLDKKDPRWQIDFIQKIVNKDKTNGEKPISVPRDMIKGWTDNAFKAIRNNPEKYKDTLNSYSDVRDALGLKFPEDAKPKKKGFFGF